MTFSWLLGVFQYEERELSLNGSLAPAMTFCAACRVEKGIVAARLSGAGPVSGPGDGRQFEPNPDPHVCQQNVYHDAEGSFVM
jgi:hypothetical protein